MAKRLLGKEVNEALVAALQEFKLFSHTERSIRVPILWASLSYWKLFAPNGSFPRVEHGRPESSKRGMTSVMGILQHLTAFAWQSLWGIARRFLGRSQL